VVLVALGVQIVERLVQTLSSHLLLLQVVDLVVVEVLMAGLVEAVAVALTE
jgi:hypothetical protein